MKYLKYFERWDMALAKRIAEDCGFNPDELIYLGSGSFGDAFKIGDKVLKITSDFEEYMNANKLRRKPVTKYLVNYYDARQIDKEGWYYVLIMDYVEPIKLNKIPIVKSAINDFEYYFDKNYKNRKEAEQDIKNNVIIPKTFEKRRKEYIDTMLQIYDIHAEGKKFNVPVLDLHTGNIGVKDDHYVYYDIGIDYIGTSKLNRLKPFNYEEVDKYYTDK